jgi:hypothetical protein
MHAVWVPRAGHAGEAGAAPAWAAGTWASRGPASRSATADDRRVSARLCGPSGERRDACASHPPVELPAAARHGASAKPPVAWHHRHRQPRRAGSVVAGGDPSGQDTTLSLGSPGGIGTRPTIAVTSPPVSMLVSPEVRPLTLFSCRTGRPEIDRPLNRRSPCAAGTAPPKSRRAPRVPGSAAIR